MKKQKLSIIVWIILIILVSIVMIASRWKAKAINPNSEKIAELNFELSELQFQKMTCLDNLSRSESKQQMNWFTKYCVEFDERIMLIESQIAELEERKAEDEFETAWTSEVRTPWTLNASWDAQEMPKIEWNDSHEKFKKLSEAYWLDASQIRSVENHYWIKEWLILCITIAETSWWNRGAWWKNIWSVWSNDRGDRPTFALMESWLEAIWKTLTNRYLWKIQTLWCLSNAWSCSSRDDHWYRYATSDWNRERNMKACLWTIYWNINASDFTIRR